jgi:site-specific recombinase XerC
MNEIAPAGEAALPGILVASEPLAQRRFLEFFAANIRNPHTRRAYARAAVDFLSFGTRHGIGSLGQIQPIHVAAWIEQIGREQSVPTVKQRLAAIRHLFDWMVVGQAMDANPAHSVRAPKHSARRGKTPVLTPEETRHLLDSIDTGTLAGVRDRALIGAMTYSFARIGAAVAMEVRDVYTQNRRLWLRLHEKGGKEHEMPCHHALEASLHTYLDAAGLRKHPRAPLFQTIGRGTGRLSGRRMEQADAYQMVRRRAKAAGLATCVGNHTFRATGITAYLKNGGTIEKAAAMANHASTRTTQLYDRRSDDVTLDEVERILI